MKKKMLWPVLLTAASLLFVSCDRAGEIPSGESRENDAVTTTTVTESLDGTADVPRDTETLPPETDTTVPELDTDSSVQYFPIGDQNGELKIPLRPLRLSDIAEISFHPTTSYAQEGYIYLRADHMGVEPSDSFYFVQQPCYLRINNYEEWQAFLEKADGDEAIGELAGINEAYFADRALILLLPMGQSGSVRYRVDKTEAADDKLSVTLTTVAPPAVTMDIVHWCIAVPVEKQHIDLSMELIVRAEQAGGREETAVPSEPAIKPRED